MISFKNTRYLAEVTAPLGFKCLHRTFLIINNDNVIQKAV